MQYIELVFFVILFSLLILLKTETLLAVIIMCLAMLLYYYYYLNSRPVLEQKKKRDLLKENLDFIEIIDLLKYTRRYDKTKHDDIKDRLETFMKIYVNILSDRWRIDLYLSTLYSLRLEILELLYSMYIVLPVRMRHVFGFKPLDRLKTMIDKFDNKSKDMIEIVRLYGKHDKGMIHLEDYTIAPSNLKQDPTLP